MSIVRVVVEGGEVLQGGAVAELVLVLGNNDHVEILIKEVSELVMILDNQDHVEVDQVSELVLSNRDYAGVLL